MEVLFKSKVDKKHNSILDYILYGNLDYKKFPIEEQVKDVLHRLTNREVKEINKIIDTLNLKDKGTSLEILYSLKKEEEKRHNV
ncbi:MAG: hypothetical protein WC356_04655 [Candidatus Micrarchaeia archaeon]|jgi:hypothetical protein